MQVMKIRIYAVTEHYERIKWRREIDLSEKLKIG